jgi:hypothetical protein
VPDLPVWDYLVDRTGSTSSHFNFEAAGTLSRRGSRVSHGRFEIRDVVFRIPRTDGGPREVPVVRARGRFDYVWRQQRGQAARLSLTDVEIHSRKGHARGRAQFSGQGHAIALRAEDADPAFLNGIVPGLLHGGRLRGTLQLQGDAEQPLRRASGWAELYDGSWKLPPDVPFKRAPIAVLKASAIYELSEETFKVDRIHVQSRLANAQLTISGRPGQTELRGKLTSSRVGQVIDAFPELAGLVQGGVGQARVRVNWRGDEARGRIDSSFRAGTLLLPATDGGAPTPEPIESARFRYDFTPGADTLHHLMLRGPKLNGDLRVTWHSDDSVAGTGKVWLTRSYTRELSGIWSLPLKLLGYSQLRSEVSLKGVASDVRLDASIAHGVRWRLLRLAVPSALQSVAEGKAPVWTKRGS